MKPFFSSPRKSTSSVRDSAITVYAINVGDGPAPGEFAEPQILDIGKQLACALPMGGKLADDAEHPLAAQVARPDALD